MQKEYPASEGKAETESMLRKAMEGYEVKAYFHNFCNEVTERIVRAVFRAQGDSMLTTYLMEAGVVNTGLRTLGAAIRNDIAESAVGKILNLTGMRWYS